MAHINLLPWREERREERQKQFVAAVVAGLAFAAFILYLVIAYTNSMIDEQNSRNAYLKQEIAVLDKKIREIKDLEQQRNDLLARMQVIQELQESRPKVVKDFDALVRTVPEGIHLNKVTRNGNTLTLEGVAESNARVSVFMRQLDANPEFEQANLRVVEKSSSNSQAIRKFSLVVKESSAKQQDKALQQGGK
jgi:type IV pilus assembly protein PilN